MNNARRLKFFQHTRVEPLFLSVTLHQPKKAFNVILQTGVFHHYELHNVYRSPNIVRVIKSRRLRSAGHVARMEEGRSAFKILTGKPTGKRSLGRPRRRWKTILE